jgi:hypothetical protein
MPVPPPLSDRMSQALVDSKAHSTTESLRDHFLLTSGQGLAVFEVGIDPEFGGLVLLGTWLADGGSRALPLHWALFCQMCFVWIPRSLGEVC